MSNDQNNSNGESNGVNIAPKTEDFANDSNDGNFFNDSNYNNDTNNNSQNNTNGNYTNGSQELNGNENSRGEGEEDSNKDSSQNNDNSSKNEGKIDTSKLEPELFRKVFVGSLKYTTTEEALRTHFTKYGELVDCVIMKESKSGKSRGFGFVTYKEPSMVDEMMKNRPHKLDGRTLEVKRATPREESGKPGAEMTTKKLFVGGIKEGMADEHLREYFSKYGKVEDAIVMKDKESNKFRGFGFVTFDDYDPVDKIVLEKFHTVNGQNVAVKKALPKDQTNSASGGGGGSGGGNRGSNLGGGNSGGGNRNNRSNFNDNRFNNDFNDDFNSNNFSEGGGFNSFSNGPGFGGNAPNMPNMNFANFAMMAQKMLQAATMGQPGNLGGGFGGGLNQGNAGNLGGGLGGGIGVLNGGGNRNQSGGGGRRGNSNGGGGPMRSNGNGNRRPNNGPYGGARNKSK